VWGGDPEGARGRRSLEGIKGKPPEAESFSFIYIQKRGQKLRFK